VGDHNDVVKLPCHPNAGDRRERLKALSGASEISVVFERLAQRYRASSLSIDLVLVIRTSRGLGLGHQLFKALIQLDIQQAIVDGISVSGR
jgi:hypothetical protein